MITGVILFIYGYAAFLKLWNGDAAIQMRKNFGTSLGCRPLVAIYGAKKPCLGANQALNSNEDGSRSGIDGKVALISCLV